MTRPTSDRASGSPLSRRRLLQLSGVAALALAGGSAFLMLGGGEHYRRLVGYAVSPKVLSMKELGILSAFCDRMVPGGSGKLSMTDARIPERIDRELAFHTPKMQGDVKAALLLLEHGALLHMSGARFSAMSDGDRDAHLERMSTGGDLERAAFGALRTVALFFYYCDERTWQKVRYPGPLVFDRKPPEADSRPDAKAV